MNRLLHGFTVLYFAQERENGTASVLDSVENVNSCGQAHVCTPFNSLPLHVRNVIPSLATIYHNK
jgi:hypothetical protein